MFTEVFRTTFGIMLRGTFIYENLHNNFQANVRENACLETRKHALSKFANAFSNSKRRPERRASSPPFAVVEGPALAEERSRERSQEYSGEISRERLLTYTTRPD